jgi:TetR/AcrR family transcriptional repressor of nem operon
MATLVPKGRAEVDSRERLLRAGLSIARRSGIKAMTVRAVATRARANLGSFVYHFGTRDTFVDLLMERWYAPMFEQLRLTADEADDALTALRRVILQLVRWIVENRAFLAHLVIDAGAGEAGAQRFLRSLDQRHPALLLRLIGQAQRARQLRRDDPLHQLLFLMSTLAAPALLLHLLGQSRAAPPELARALSSFAGDIAQVEIRLGWALRGLAPDGPGG